MAVDMERAVERLRKLAFDAARANENALATKIDLVADDLAASLDGMVLIERDVLRDLVDCAAPFPRSNCEAPVRRADKWLAAQEETP